MRRPVTCDYSHRQWTTREKKRRKSREEEFRTGFATCQVETNGQEKKGQVKLKKRKENRKKPWPTKRVGWTRVNSSKSSKQKS